MTVSTSILQGDPDVRDRVTLAGGQAVIRILQAHTKSGENEDAAIGMAIGGTEGVLAVADGAGGHTGAAEAASITVRTIGAFVERAFNEHTETRAAILGAIEQANREILAGRTGGACTVAVAEIHGRTVQPYHVGDAQVLIVGQRGRIHHQSVAHSPVGYAVQAGLMDEPEAIRHAERHLISNAVGMDEMRIEIGPVITLAPRDTVLVASDGVYDNLYVQEIVDAIRVGPIDEACDRLTEATRARMMEAHPDHPSKPDDIGVALFRRGRERRRD